jgi:phosphohistidine phosphatase
MKTLLLLRHAKSDWDASYAEDHERPLAKRGKKAAALIGRHLAATGQVPDRVVSSTAVRAADTVRRAIQAGGWECPVEHTEALYAASAEEVLQAVRGWQDPSDRVLLAGHEPTCSSLTGRLIGGANLHFPTAAVARIDFEVDVWSQVEVGGGTLVWLLTPKALRSKSKAGASGR